MHLVDALLDRYYRWRASRYGAARPWESPIRAAGFYPAYSDWVGAFGVDAAGEVWFAEHGQSWSERQPVREPELQHAARGVAAVRHPAVPGLAPARGPDAVPCPQCDGHGVMYDLPARVRYAFVCQCGGLGWVPSSFRPPEDRPDRLAFLDKPR